jgi:hypothetical protein
MANPFLLLHSPYAKWGRPAAGASLPEDHEGSPLLVKYIRTIISTPNHYSRMISAPSFFFFPLSSLIFILHPLSLILSFGTISTYEKMAILAWGAYQHRFYLAFPARTPPE